MQTKNSITDFSEYTVKNSVEPSFYGSDCTAEDAQRIANSIGDLICSEFPGINVKTWTDSGTSSKTTGPDAETVDEINTWISENWTAAL